MVRFAAAMLHNVDGREHHTFRLSGEKESGQSEREVSPMQEHRSSFRVGLAVNSICINACVQFHIE
jgi:hypothetical protein